MTSTRAPHAARGLPAAVAVLAAAFVLLAPWSCVQACAAGTADGCGPTTCTTLLGLHAPLGEAWFVVPLAALAALVLLRRVGGHALLLLAAAGSAALTVAVLAVRPQLPAVVALALAAVVLLSAALLPSRDQAQRRLALAAAGLVLAAPVAGLLLDVLTRR